MRELKFRVWEPLNRKMYSMDYSLYKDHGNEKKTFALPLENQSLRDSYCSMNLNAINVMQFTGVKDSKGNEIYESDILSISDREDGFQAVFFDEGFYSTDEFALFELVRSENRTFEVVGNIYENPELITL